MKEQIRSLLDLLVESGDVQVSNYGLNKVAEQLTEQGADSSAVLEYCRENGWTNLNDSDADAVILGWRASQHQQVADECEEDTVDAGSLGASDPSVAMPEKIGSYKIIKLVGKGGFGSVYLAEREDMPGLQYAVKVLNNFEDPEVRERFKDEAVALRLITHANCVCVFEVELDSSSGDQPPYMVLEWIDGQKFDQVVQSMLENDRLVGALRLWRDVCLGVWAYHLAGIIHCDLKPDNILVVLAHGTERPVVLDPLARRLTGEADDSDRVVGTPLYMAPEQATCGVITAATDVYALGGVIYKALTKENVHNGISAMDVMSKVVKQVGVPSHVAGKLRKVIKGRALADRIIVVLSKCLHPDPSKRYKDAGELVKAINDEILGFIRDEERRRQRRRGRQLWWLAAALVISTVVGGIAYERTNKDRLRQIENARLAKVAGDEQARRADVQAEMALEQRKRADAEAQIALEARKTAEAQLGQLEAEKRASEEAKIRELAQIEARKKVEGLLEELREQSTVTQILLKEVQDQNTVAEGLYASQVAIKAWRWKKARDILKDILKLEPDSYRIREPLAEVFFNLQEPCCVEEYRWLASKHDLTTPESRKIRWEFQLKAMVALLDFPLAKSAGKKMDAVTKLATITEIAQDFTKEPYISVAWMLQQDAKVALLTASGKKSEAEQETLAAGKKAMGLYESPLDSTLVKYVVALHLEPLYMNRDHTLKLLDAVAEDTDDFLPALMARQRNCRFVVSEMGIKYERAEELLRSAQKDLLKLRKRFPGSPEIDMAYIDCLATMAGMHVFRDEHIALIRDASREAKSYLKLRGTNTYRKHAYLIEITLAYTFAVKYRWAKSNHKAGTKRLRQLGFTALKKARQRRFESSDLNLKRHKAEREQLVLDWLK